MYSRYHKQTDGEIKLPDNYGGVAFSEHHFSKNEGDSTAHTLEVAKPSPLPVLPLPTGSANETEHPPGPENTPPVQKKTSPHPHRPPLTPLLPMGALESFPFAHGIGFEELFIIALMILLSRNEQSSDVVLWLALLLFCG